MRGGSERVSRQLLDCLTSAPPVLCVVPRPTIGVMVGEDGGRCAPGLLAALCPRGVVCVEERGEGIASDPAVVLLPGEEARIARALCPPAFTNTCGGAGSRMRRWLAWAGSGRSFPAGSASRSGPTAS